MPSSPPHHAASFWPAGTVSDPIWSAVPVVAEGLRRLELSTLPISAYNLAYLRGHLRHVERSLYWNAQVLAWALAEMPRPIGDVTFLDYGGGNGNLSLLARQAGVGRVIYQDLFEDSRRAAVEIGKALRLPADEYLVGDVDECIEQLAGLHLSCDAVGSFDVIEHIYDIEAYLRRIGDVSTGPLSLSFASTANGANPVSRYILQRKHYRAEHVERQAQPDDKPIDSPRAFLPLRLEMIQGHAGQRISATDARELAGRTRGMCRPDILRAVDRFLAEGTMPAERRDTNTCDPETGNWCEHVMDVARLCQVLREQRFRTRVVPGFFGPNQHLRATWRFPMAGVDRLGGWLPHGAQLRLAPYYLIHAVRTAPECV